MIGGICCCCVYINIRVFWDIYKESVCALCILFMLLFIFFICSSYVTNRVHKFVLKQIFIPWPPSVGCRCTEICITAWLGKDWEYPAGNGTAC